MSSLKKALLWAVSVIFVSTTSYAGESGHVPISSNTHTFPHIAELKPIPNSYQLAKAQFLPELNDSEFGWGGNTITGDRNQGDNCGGYELTACPAHGNCSSCPFNRKYKKLISCASGYTRNGNSCSASSCSAAGYEASIPVNKICTKVTEGSLTCYKDCKSVSCSGYTLNCDTFNVANSSGKTTCPDCESANANCSPKLCKVSSCMSGFKIADNGTTCVALDDTCPADYFKTCETGTQGDPEYTEKGTACYQCKPKTTENMKVVVNFAKSCPAGLSFKMTPQGRSAVTCSSSQCYEYDTDNYPYAPDGIHSNETESIVTVGTQINLSSIPSAVSDIKSVSKKQTYSVSGTTYSFNVNDRATVIAGVGQDTSSGLGAYDFWTLQCNSRLAMPGDILYSDMTTSSELISGKTPIGVVFDGERKLAVALNEEGKFWSTEYFDITGLFNQSLSEAKTSFNGQSNTKTIVDYCKKNSKSCPAAEYAYSYTTKGTTAGDWFLPSLGELNLIYTRKNTLNPVLTSLSGTAFGKGSGTYWHWSSSEDTSTTAWLQDFNYGNMFDVNKFNLYNTVRPIINYGDVKQTCTPLANDNECAGWRQYPCSDGCGGRRKCCGPYGYKYTSCTHWVVMCKQSEVKEAQEYCKITWLDPCDILGTSSPECDRNEYYSCLDDVEFNQCSEVVPDSSPDFIYTAPSGCLN